MKNIFLSVFVFIFFSCSVGDDSYSIKGTLEQGVDLGDTLYLMTATNGKPSMLGKSAVENGAFSFSGHCDTTLLCSVIALKSGRVHRNVDVFLEPGELHLHMTAQRNILSGTELNEKLQEYNDSILLLNALYDTYYKKSLTPIISDAAMDEALKVMQIATMVRNKYVDIFIERNIDNHLSAYIIKNNYTSISPERGLELISSMPEWLRNDSSIKVIVSMYKAMMRTAVGEKFEDFELSDMEGRKVCLSDIAGNGEAVLLSFWASGIDKSVEEQKYIASLQSKYPGKLKFVSVSADKVMELWRNAVAQNDFQGIQLTDLKGWESEALSSYGISQIPAYILIDADGVIVERTFSIETIEKTIDGLLKR